MKIRQTFFPTQRELLENEVKDFSINFTHFTQRKIKTVESIKLVEELNIQFLAYVNKRKEDIKEELSEIEQYLNTKL